MSLRRLLSGTSGWRDELKIVRRLLTMIRFSTGSVAAIVGLGILASFFEGLGLYLFVPLLTALSGGGADPGSYPAAFQPLVGMLPQDQLALSIAGLVLASILLKNIISYANAAAFAWVNCKAGHKLRTALYRQILSASALYVAGAPKGRIPNAMLSESWRAVEALGVLYRLIIDGCAAVVLLGVLLLISWKGALLVIPTALLVMSILHRATRSSREMGKRGVEANAAFVQKFWQTYEGLKTIRNFGQARREAEEFARISGNVQDVFFRMQLLSSQIGPLSEILTALALAAWAMILYRLDASLSGVAVFLLVVYRLQPRLRSLAGGRVQLLQHATAVEEIAKVGSCCEASALPDGRRPLTKLQDGIEFRDASFSYPGRDSEALRNVSFSVPAGSNVAIVGKSGAGKSTLIDLLCRNIDPISGQVLVDGTDLRDILQSDWKQRVAIVSQDIHLFSATVAQNISYGVANPDRELLETAARQAHCHDFIEALPSGYETEVGERGVQLSGGQRQRLALARALIRKPDLLILDEATNALDAESERMIQAALMALPQSTTLVTIAHRIATIADSDFVVVLDKGQVAEIGPARRLSRHGGIFANLERLQAIAHLEAEN